MTVTGITRYGAYVPRLRIARKCIADAHAWMSASGRSGVKGSRAFCNWDEDAVTMAVEAARDCISPADRAGVDALSLASTTLPFSDLQCSAVVAGALRLKDAVRSIDIAHSQRGGTSALIQALQEPLGALVVASERPVAKPGSPQELGFGAGAAALCTGSRDLIAECCGTASLTTSFVDHYRAEGQAFDYSWEERWIRDVGLTTLLPRAARAALERAGLAVDEISSLIVPPVLAGAAKAVAGALGYKGRLAEDLVEGCGFTGAAHPLLMLARALEVARPGDILLLLGFGQGADAIVFRTTEAVLSRRPGRGVAGSLQDRVDTDSYMRLLSFYDNISLDWGMRSERETKTMLSAQYRGHDQVEGFVAGRCAACGTIQFPRLQYCVNGQCRAPAAQMTDVSLADEPSSVFTFTNDWLFYYPAPPLRLGFIQFANGARVPMEMVDAPVGGIEVGMPMRQVFRVKDIDRERGYRRYFWKATPVRLAGG